MENWREQLAAHGVNAKKKLGAPKLLYTIPTGQNPTGIVVSLKRKKEIYKASRKTLNVKIKAFFHQNFHLAFFIGFDPNLNPNLNLGL